MKIEEQVLSIEQAKHLQSLGLDMSDAALCWWRYKTNAFGSNQTYDWDLCRGEQKDKSYGLEYVPTYTLQEILGKLPEKILINNEEYLLDCAFKPMSVYYYSARDDAESIEFNTDDEDFLEASYKTLCWILKKGYLNK